MEKPTEQRADEWGADSVQHRVRRPCWPAKLYKLTPCMKPAELSEMTYNGDILENGKRLKQYIRAHYEVFDTDGEQWWRVDSVPQLENEEG